MMIDDDDESQIGNIQIQYTKGVRTPSYKLQRLSWPPLSFSVSLSPPFFVFTFFTLSQFA
jgi:hypothetical protein